MTNKPRCTARLARCAADEPITGGAMKTIDHQQPRDEPASLPPVLTVDEAAAFLRLNVKTVYAAIKARQIPAKTIGRRLVILRDALLASLGSK